jgi:hypothetical protein
MNHVKSRIGGVIAIIEYGRDENHTLDRLDGMNASKVVMGIHMYRLALKNNILVDVTEDYRNECTLPQTKLS